MRMALIWVSSTPLFLEDENIFSKTGLHGSNSIAIPLGMDLRGICAAGKHTTTHWLHLCCTIVKLKNIFQWILSDLKIYSTRRI